MHKHFQSTKIVHHLLYWSIQFDSNEKSYQFHRPQFSKHSISIFEFSMHLLKTTESDGSRLISETYNSDGFENMESQ